MNVRPSIALALLLLPACVVLRVHDGNGVAAREARDVDPFVGVENRSPLDVEVTTSPGQGVEVSCDQNLLVDIATWTDDRGDLIVETMGKDGVPVELLPETPCFVTVWSEAGVVRVRSHGSGELQVESPALEDVESTGSGDVLVGGAVQVEALSVAATGSGEVVLEQVDAGLVDLLVTGSGDLTVLQGTAARLDLTDSGSGDVHARGLVAEDASVTLTGSGDVEVTVTGALDADVTGSGDLSVWGDPTSRDVRATGSGEVVYRE